LVLAIVMTIPGAAQGQNLGPWFRGGSSFSALTPATTVTNRFWTLPSTQVSVASDGHYVVRVNVQAPLGNYEIVATTMRGRPAGLTESLNDLFCKGKNPLPACADGYDFAGDSRVIYDPQARRWVVSAMWVTLYDPHPAIPASVLVAVSVGPKPNKHWYRYQLPVCGPNSAALADQPHLGFSKYWIAINSLCNQGSADRSLNLLDKAALYAGEPPVPGQNWWEFQDGVTPDNGRDDNPVSTYSPDVAEQYFTHSQFDSDGRPQIVYSYIDGDEFNPQPHWGTETVTLDGPPLGFAWLWFDTPTCTGCLSFWTMSLVHSSQVVTLPDGDAWLLTAAVFANPAYANSGVAGYVATDLRTGETRTTEIGGDGSGIMAAEITGADVSTNPDVTDPVYLIESVTSPTFFPGLRWHLWDVANGAVTDLGSIQGTQAPAGDDVHRWVDFLQGASPTPPSKWVPPGSVTFSGPVATPSNCKGWQCNNPNDKATIVVTTNGQ
jgi:hypothetical protein